MKYAEAKQGRTFIVRLDEDEPLAESLKQLARDEDIRVASIVALGATGDGSVLRVGPFTKPDGRPGVLSRTLAGPHEVAGTGTLVWGDKGEPEVHLHLACGRDGETITGCVGDDVRVGYCMELFITELVGTQTVRGKDPDSGRRLLLP